MTHEYFSDRELGKKELVSEDITVSVFNGIVGVYNKYLKNFAREFPVYCDDQICGPLILGRWRAFNIEL